MRLMGNSAFFASMNENLIDFPPWRKSGGALEDVALLPEDLVLPAKPLQLRRNILRAGLGRLIDQTVPAATDPTNQRRKSDPQVVGDLALRAPAGLHQPNGLGLKILRKSSLLHRGVPRPSLGTLHFSEASPLRVAALLNPFTGWRLARRSARPWSVNLPSDLTSAPDFAIGGHGFGEAGAQCPNRLRLLRLGAAR
jgi:hypothetical protein